MTAVPSLARVARLLKPGELCISLPAHVLAPEGAALTAQGFNNSKGNTAHGFKVSRHGGPSVRFLPQLGGRGADSVARPPFFQTHNLAHRKVLTVSGSSSRKTMNDTEAFACVQKSFAGLQRRRSA